jgi:hypothetical protein
MPLADPERSRQSILLGGELASKKPQTRDDASGKKPVLWQ